MRKLWAAFSEAAQNFNSGAHMTKGEQALELRATGITWREVGEAMGCTLQQARNAALKSSRLNGPIAEFEAHKAHLRAKHRKHYLANREKAKADYQANRAERLAYGKAYYQENRASRDAYRRAYRATPKGIAAEARAAAKQKAKQKAYRAANPKRLGSPPRAYTMPVPAPRGTTAEQAQALRAHGLSWGAIANELGLASNSAAKHAATKGVGVERRRAETKARMEANAKAHSDLMAARAQERAAVTEANRALRKEAFAAKALRRAQLLDEVAALKACAAAGWPNHEPMSDEGRAKWLRAKGKGWTYHRIRDVMGTGRDVYQLINGRAHKSEAVRERERERDRARNPMKNSIRRFGPEWGPVHRAALDLQYAVTALKEGQESDP